MHRDSLQPRPLAAMLPTLTLFVLLLLVLMGISPAGFYHHTWLPTARTAGPAMKNRVTVGIDKNGVFWIHDVPDPGPIPARQMAERLRTAFASRGGEEMYLVADRNVEYVWVQRMISAAAEAGVREVQLIVECPRGGESLTRACRT